PGAGRLRQGATHGDRGQVQVRPRSVRRRLRQRAVRHRRQPRQRADLPRPRPLRRGLDQAAAGRARATEGAVMSALLLALARAAPVGALTGHEGTVTCLAWSADGKSLASGSKDGTVRVWDAATGKARLVLPGHPRMATAAAFAPDGKMIATAADDRDVRLWDA